jgi:hypothetical protein
MKEICGEDGFLGWLHSLVLMDDTVIFQILHEFCVSHDIVINAGKNKTNSN